jgi:hypothetical protein
MKVCDLCQLYIPPDEEYTISVRYKEELTEKRHYHKECYCNKKMREDPADKIEGKAIRHKHEHDKGQE